MKEAVHTHFERYLHWYLLIALWIAVLIASNVEKG